MNTGGIGLDSSYTTLTAIAPPKKLQIKKNPIFILLGIRNMTRQSNSRIAMGTILSPKPDILISEEVEIKE